MKAAQLWVLLLPASLMIACGSNNNEENSGGEKDPSVMHPPSQAIPDSTKLVNDSVIVPDLTPGNGRQVGNSDSTQKNIH
jgi:hypothetical protein